MNILQVVSASVCVSVIILTVKNIKSDTGQLITITAVASLMIAVLPYITAVISGVREFSEMSSLGGKYLEPVLKITGIAYVTQLGSELCRDSGENSLASGVENAGKIAITVIALPVAREAFLKIMGILS